MNSGVATLPAPGKPVMQRFLNPLLSTFVREADVKALLAVVLTLLSTVAEWLVPALKGVLAQEPAFVVVLVVLIVLDWITGITFKVVIRRQARLSSGKMVEGATKIVLYLVLVVGAGMIANAFAGSVLSVVTDLFDDLAYFYAISAEFISNLENISGSPDRARALLRRVWGLRRLLDDPEKDPFEDEVNA